MTKPGRGDGLEDSVFVGLPLQFQPLSATEDGSPLLLSLYLMGVK